MLNRGVRREAIKKLDEAAAEHDRIREVLLNACREFHEGKEQAIRNVIEPTEEYLGQLANAPKDFNKAVSDCRVEVDRFHETVEEVAKQANSSDALGGVSAGAAGLAGAGIAFLGPGAAMWIATTFGTASTGAAISTLSGAAATSAALAWLGGGTLVAGGGGMALGSRVLFLFGPVGWTVGTALTTGSVLLYNRRNKKQAKAATEMRIQAEEEIRSMKTALEEIVHLHGAIKDERGGSESDLWWLKRNAPEDYQSFDEEQKMRLAVLINHAQSLTELLRREVTL